MNSVFTYFQSNPPRCLDIFKPLPIEVNELQFDGHGEEINPIFQIKCKCGNSEYAVSGYYWLNPDSGKTYFIGPLLLKCTACKVENELFNIEHHGYYSELGHGCFSASGKGKAAQYKCDLCEANSFKLLVRFECSDDLFDDDF